MGWLYTDSTWTFPMMFVRTEWTSSLFLINQKCIFPEEVATVIQNDSMADELKKFKDLLDSGVITQEEFDAKKKQLLGL